MGLCHGSGGGVEAALGVQLNAVVQEGAGNHALRLDISHLVADRLHGDQGLAKRLALLCIQRKAQWWVSVP